ncbi:MAG: amino acid ABC transporter permease [Candidatus Thorarchaeota archaeon]
MQESVDLWTLIESIIVYGLPTSLFLTAIGLIFGFIIGLILALVRVYGNPEMRFFSNVYETILRGIPILVLMMIFGWGIPNLFWFVPAQFRTLAGVILSLSLRSGAYQSQLYRGAILSVSEGQLLAARSIGMTQLQASRYIVLPQALRIAVPGFSNEYAVIIKDSAYAAVVGVAEMFRISRAFSMSYPQFWIPIMFTVAIIYMLFTLPVTKLIGERQTKKLKDLGLGGG